MAAGVNAWYKSTLLFLFFIPVAVGTAYYLAPKVTGRPVYSYSLALLSFWALAVICPWAGMQKLVGSPLPQFMPYVGAAATGLFFIPAITMGLLSEEKRSGTLELLLTKAVTDRQVVLGKFLAAFLLIFIALAFTSIYVITLSNIGNLDNGGVISGYFGLLLMSAAYISIGLFASSLTSNQIVAFLLTLLISLFFHILFDMLAMDSNTFIGQIFSYLSLANHYEGITRGVIDSKDLVYFASIIGLGLLLSEMSISKRNLSN